MLALNYRDSQPIYNQIKNGLRRLIVNGALEPGEKLPTVRAMAMDLAINPKAIQRAYTELESEGFIHSVPGEGSFAGKNPKPASSPESAPEDRKAALMQQLHGLIAELRYLDVSSEELIAVIEEGGGK